MRGVDVPYVKPGPFPVKPTGPKRTEASVVCELGNRVGLINHLGEVSPGEEVINGGGDRFGVDERFRGLVSLPLHVQAILHGPPEPEEPDSNLFTK